MSPVHVSPRGLAEIAASSAMRRGVNEAAEAVAANIKGQNIMVGDLDAGNDQIPMPVEVTNDDTGSARTLVSLAHPAGEAVQAKHGSLTKAAAQAGLDVGGQA